MEKGGLIDAESAKAAYTGLTPEMIDQINDKINELKGYKTQFEDSLKNQKLDMFDKQRIKDQISKLNLDIEEKQALIAGTVTDNVSGKGDTKKQAQDLSEQTNIIATDAEKGSNEDVASKVNAVPSTRDVTRAFAMSSIGQNLLLEYFRKGMSKEKSAKVESTLNNIAATNRNTVSNVTGNKGQMTGADVAATQNVVNKATTAAQIIVENKQYKGLTRGQAIMGITFILSIAGLGGYMAYNDAATNDAIDKLTKTILGLNKKNTDGCFLITNTGYSRLDDDCSTWYSTGDNKFSCGCGTLTDTKQAPDCSALKDNDRDCTAPYCLGQATCTNPIDPAKTSKCTVKNNPTQPLYQCTGKDLNDPNFISYAYSDSLPLEPLISAYTINKQIYDQYYNSSEDKTLMYVSIGISALSLLVLVFFIVRYYMRKK